MKHIARHLIVFILLSVCECAVLSAQSKTKTVCLYGTVGGRTKHRREELGTVTADLADFCILTTDNPDFEAPEQIIADLIPYYNADTAPYVAIVDR